MPGPAGKDGKDGTDGAPGRDGTDGKDGTDGQDGADGYSPAASVSKSGSTATITITDKNGTTTATVSDGQDGQDGTNGTDGTDAYVYIRYSAGEPTQDSDMKTTPDAWIGIYSGDAATAPTAYTAYTWYKIKGETGAAGVVQDVQVNGVSVLDAQGVANVPVADANNVGVVKVNSSYGIKLATSGTLQTNYADNNAIKGGTNQYAPIVPYKQDVSTFYALAKAAGDTTQSQSSNAVGTYTETAKSKISDMLSAPVPVTGSTPTITALSGIQYVCGEVSTLDITLPASGIVDVVFTSGSTPTVLTITPPTGVTVKWANGFDPTALDANTTYELNIKDGLGVAGSWS